MYNHTLAMKINPKETHKGTILIIDDSQFILEFMFHFLSMCGFKVLVSTNGESAIYQAEYAQPDLIILDVVMPKINGFEICSRLKKNEATKNIPVIFMTALSEPKDQVKGFQLGAVDYITKPIQQEELLARVTTHLTVQNLQKQLREQNWRLQQQMARERLVTTMQERIRQSLNLEEILNTTVKEVRQFLQTDRVIIYQFQSDNIGVVAVESVGVGWKSIAKQTILEPCLKEKSLEFYKTGNTRAISDIYQHDLPQCHIDLLAEFEVRSNLIVPIRQGEKLWGLLIAHHCSKPRYWQQVEIDLLKQLVTQVGIAIQQAQLYEELKEANEKLNRLASLDSLTQLANRRRFNTYLNEQWECLVQKKLPLSLILCDIDFFKLYNDTYGHLAGDFCLQQVAEAIQKAVNCPAALVARYGGEELSVILPNAKTEDAFFIAEQIREAVKVLKIAHARSPIDRYLTLSLGVASIVPSPGFVPEQLIAVADRALYRAKEEGRDRVLIGEEYPLVDRAENLQNYR
ncbi:MAG TPA: diguanylate cyclase [Leptolyngbyaceae cyanobacterium]